VSTCRRASLGERVLRCGRSEQMVSTRADAFYVANDLQDVVSVFMWRRNVPLTSFSSVARQQYSIPSRYHGASPMGSPCHRTRYALRNQSGTNSLAVIDLHRSRQRFRRDSRSRCRTHPHGMESTDVGVARDGARFTSSTLAVRPAESGQLLRTRRTVHGRRGTPQVIRSQHLVLIWKRPSADSPVAGAAVVAALTRAGPKNNGWDFLLVKPIAS